MHTNALTTKNYIITDGSRKVIYQYSSQSNGKKLTRILHDRNVVDIRRNTENSEIESIQNNASTINYHRNGLKLVKQQLVSTGNTEAAFFYFYDSYLRITSVKVRILNSAPGFLFGMNIYKLKLQPWKNCA